MSVPDVSVIVGAYEAMPYLMRCLESVEQQSLPADRIELIAVDDGSTDGTGEYLEKFAARTALPTRVVHQENSGGPSGPRNHGLDLARGRYVLFLDADDYLGEEALERLVAAGDQNGTDVVLGRVEGVNRGAPKSMWSSGNIARTDVFSSSIKYTLSAQKLFRRALLERHGMRFDTSLTTGEDALFTMDAYLRADGVSVVADYTCYYLVGRDDGNHATKRGGYRRRFDSARALMQLIAERVPAGPRRDVLMMRPFTVTLLHQFGPAFADQSERVRADKLALARPLMDAYWTPALAARLRVEQRLRLHLVAEGRADLLDDVLRFLVGKKIPEPVVERRGRRVYLAYPHFRDPASAVPDTMYAAGVQEAAAVPGFRPPRLRPALGAARRRARRLWAQRAVKRRGTGPADPAGPAGLAAP